MRVVAFVMRKGGVGKTMTTLNAGATLANSGARVLLVDLDPQANLTEGLGVDPQERDYSIYEVLLNLDREIREATVKTAYGVDLIPSRLALASAELDLSGKIGREMLRRDALIGSEEHYNYVLLSQAVFGLDKD